MVIVTNANGDTEIRGCQAVSITAPSPGQKTDPNTLIASLFAGAYTLSLENARSASPAANIAPLHLLANLSDLPEDFEPSDALTKSLAAYSKLLGLFCGQLTVVARGKLCQTLESIPLLEVFDCHNPAQNSWLTTYEYYLDAHNDNCPQCFGRYGPQLQDHWLGPMQKLLSELLTLLAESVDRSAA